MRLDNYIAEKLGYTRSRAANLIKMGSVAVNGKTADKLGYIVKDGDDVSVSEHFEYASAGGYKLAKAFECFETDVKGKACVDIGASNGGFCDCLLKNGAKKVYAVDVAECALPDFLKNDPRIIIKDKLNARSLAVEAIGEYAEIVTIDVSFISLKLILETAKRISSDNAEIFALIKPQFEAGKRALNKKGIVITAKDRAAVVSEIIDYSASIGLYAADICAAPIRDGKNVEYVIRLTKSSENYRIRSTDVEFIKGLESK